MKFRTPLEFLWLGLVIVSVLAAWFPAILLIVVPDEIVLVGLLESIAITAFALSVAISAPMDGLHKLRRKARGSRKYERARRAQTLRVSGSLNSLLLILTLMFVGLFMLIRTNIVGAPETSPVMLRILAGLAGLYVTNAAVAHYQSMNVKREEALNPRARWVSTFLVAVGVIFGGIALVTVLFGPLEVGNRILDLEIVPLYQVLALMASGLGLAFTRQLPSIASMMGELAQRGTGDSRKAVWLPTAISFTILFVFVLIMVVFGTGFVQTFSAAGGSPISIFLLAFMVLAIFAGIGLSVWLVRSKEKLELYKTKAPREEKIETALVVGSVSLALSCLFLAFLINQGQDIFGIDRNRWLDVAAIGILVGVGPYGFYAARQARNIQMMEGRFPDFLRDLASSHRGGLTLPQAVKVAARGDYGPLTTEIRKMADQLSWNIDFQETLKRLAERVRTPLVQRSVTLILEAGRSGGSTSDVLLAAARDARELKNLERERKLSMSVYTIVIYTTFFVFLFVIAVMYNQFVPEIISATEKANEGALAGASIVSGGVSLDDYRTLYFSASMVQAIGNGIVAGLMGSGSIVLGLRHSFIMSLTTYITFGVMLA